MITVFNHVIGDFLLQTEKTAEERESDNRKVRVRANFRHSITILGINILILPILFDFRTNKYLFLYCMLIGISHFMIDSLKSFIIIKTKKHSNEHYINLVCFIIDQVLHIIVIIFIWSFFNFKYAITIEIIKKALLNSDFNALFNYYNKTSVKKSAYNLIFLLNLIIYVCVGGDIFIRKILNIISKNQSTAIKIKNTEQDIKTGMDQYNISNSEAAATLIVDDTNQKNKEISRRIKKQINNTYFFYSFNNDKENRIETESELTNEKRNGKYIGIIERLIVFILTINNQFTSIAFILTAKSIVRSKKIEKHEEFAEKYLIGTLLSIFIGILGGCIFTIIKLK